MLSRLILSIDRSPRWRTRLWGLVFGAGLLTWLVVQGALLVVPLWQRATFPEVDDILGYLVKAEQMDSCFFQDCPALEDLAPQLLEPSSNPLAADQRALAASRVFPVYHVLLSAVLVGLSKIGLNLVDGYKLLWTLSPLFFGTAFACLLWSMWGARAAGLALGLLAFKVFPDTGLNHLAPSNLAMGMAALVWARIVSREGRAYLTLPVGSLVLIALHPVGRIYAFMGAAFSLALNKDDRKNRWSAAVTLALILVSSLLSFFVHRPVLLKLSPFSWEGPIFQGFLTSIRRSAAEIISNLVRLEAGLFGLLPFFFLFLTLGFLTAGKARRSTALKVSALYLAFLLGLVHYGPTQPADAFFRVWIPLAVIAFGAVGQSLLYILEALWQETVETFREGRSPRTDLCLKNAWPLLALAVFTGYAVHMTTRGGEQVAATIAHQIASQPLVLSAEQPAKLLAAAEPGDRVLYTSMILMPWYFIHGAMDQGAVYYHHDLAETPVTKRWIQRTDIRFAVTYNPLVWNPSYQGMDENHWWTSAPEFRFSPLSRRRKHPPLAREGKLDGRDFKWIEVRPRSGSWDRLRLRIDNPGPGSRVEILTIDHHPIKKNSKPEILPVPADWSGWLEVPYPDGSSPTGVRLVFPVRCAYGLTGLVFDDSPFQWPWLTRADLDLMTRDFETGLVRVGFDPADCLPPGPDQKTITVLDDYGSSVLFRIGP